MSSALNCLMVSASLVLTMAFLAVGISFFGPYWLSNVPSAEANETAFTNGTMFLNRSGYSYNLFPDRGLWAQCGVYCYWFWNDNYLLQKNLLTPLKWHLATQVLYFVGATIILFCEFYTRMQWCCETRRRAIPISLAVILLVSVLIQTGALAAFGAGASRFPYNAISDPRQFTYALGQFKPGLSPYLGWCFWMAVVGDMLTVLAGGLFLAASFCDPE